MNFYSYLKTRFLDAVNHDLPATRNNTFSCGPREDAKDLFHFLTYEELQGVDITFTHEGRLPSMRFTQRFQ